MWCMASYNKRSSKKSISGIGVTITPFLLSQVLPVLPYHPHLVLEGIHKLTVLALVFANLDFFVPVFAAQNLAPDEFSEFSQRWWAVIFLEKFIQLCSNQVS